MRVLAGPIVRRVEPRLAAIWVAMDVDCKVDLDIWNNIQSAANLPLLADFRASAQTVRAGDGLFIALVVADLKDAVTPLLPEIVYSYNLTFTPAAGGKQTLRGLGLLKDRAGPRPHLALGYGTDVLPGFVLPPRQLKDLRILHGSCRRVGYRAPDAMRWIDDFIAEARTDAVKRPHQLFLTGDQIYADNLPTPMQQVLTPIANTLIGPIEKLPTRFPLAQSPDLKPLECTLANFPAGLRKNLMLFVARTTTSDGKNHLLSFGEFCAMHLMAWSNELWPDPDTLPDAKHVYAQLPPSATIPQIWAVHLGLLGGFSSNTFPPDIKNPLGDDARSLGLNVSNANQVLNFFVDMEPGGIVPRVTPRDKDKNYDTLNEYLDDVSYTREFMEGLPRVRRALANIATYMIFDDHEISDDWNFSKIWTDRVMTSPLGRTMLRNGLMAYALFQGWGNDPKQFIDPVRDEHGAATPSPQKQLLDAIPQMFPSGASDTPVAAVADKIDLLLGLGGVEPKPQVTWHYRVPGARHLVLVLDVRTRRDHLGRTAAPQNLSEDAAKEQLPTETDPALVNLSSEIDVVLVISSLVVLGPPIFDALFGPLAYKIFDIKDHIDRVTLPATDPDAIESWANDDVGFERLLDALEPLKRVVLLSGDVHYSTTVAMSYWKNRSEPPARFAQFVSSAFRNNFEDKLAWADQSFALFQKAMQLNGEAARLGWNNFTSDLLSVPAGARPLPALEARLRDAPMLLPTLGWPPGTHEKAANPPDFGWRTHIIRDHRADSARPEAQRAAALFPDSPAHDVTATAEAYKQVAARHAKLLDKVNYTRQILFSTNLGLIRFERNGDVVTAINQFYSTHPKALLPDKPEVYMEHRVELDTPLEPPPHIGTPS